MDLGPHRGAADGTRRASMTARLATAAVALALTGCGSDTPLQRSEPSGGDSGQAFVANGSGACDRRRPRRDAALSRQADARADPGACAIRCRIRALTRARIARPGRAP